MARAIDGTWSKFVWNLSESESLARKFRDGKACLIDLRLAVEAQPTLTPPNEWVSVEERLPERGKDVLLYFGEESRISVGGRYDVGGGWYAVIVNEYETICDTSPRSWMPLPESPDRRPPEGGDADHA